MSASSCPDSINALMGLMPEPGGRGGWGGGGASELCLRGGGCVFGGWRGEAGRRTQTAHLHMLNPPQVVYLRAKPNPQHTCGLCWLQPPHAGTRHRTPPDPYSDSPTEAWQQGSQPTPASRVPAHAYTYSTYTHVMSCPTYLLQTSALWGCPQLGSCPLGSPCPSQDSQTHQHLMGVEEWVGEWV